ncbi:DUF3422 family protein [Sphingopyxis sp. USTB-05]|uniref:DUF3422 family protein n=1 Tax=Sphingopyxis sp. USTB-05 TaxID=2830667 RepID=UPI002078F0D4|nr:DUF3422 family protein [Sphingopyxis sp. USTB-05]
MQHTVERLSVAAITNYMANVLHLMLAGAHTIWQTIDAEFLTAAATPFLFAAITFAMLRIRRHHRDAF